MSQSKSFQSRVIPVLVFLFVAIFAGVLALRYSPWGAPEPVPGATPALVTSGEIAPQFIELEVENGVITMLLRPDIAPLHVARLTELAEEGFYDGILFHRVIEGFMAQTGDPTGTGMGGSTLPDLVAEFSDEPFLRGTIGMARSQSPDSANSQFFIVLEDARHLDGAYTVLGSVVEGMEFVDALKKGSPPGGTVTDPDHVVTMRVVAAL